MPISLRRSYILEQLLHFVHLLKLATLATNYKFDQGPFVQFSLATSKLMFQISFQTLRPRVKITTFPETLSTTVIFRQKF